MAKKDNIVKADQASLLPLKNIENLIRVIDQENRGHGGAWNHGTELAVGKYLFYLDSDDWFDTSELSKLITYLGHCNTDMVMLDGQNYYAATDTYTEKGKHDELTPENFLYSKEMQRNRAARKRLHKEHLAAIS